MNNSVLCTAFIHRFRDLVLEEERMDVSDTLYHALTFMTPKNGLELAKFRKLQLVNKLWQEPIKELTLSAIKEEWFKTDVYLDDFADWLLDPETSRGDLNLYPDSTPGYFAEDGEPIEYKEKFASVCFIANMYPGRDYGFPSKMVSLDLYITDKEIIDEETVEFSIYAVGQYRHSNVTLWDVYLRWDMGAAKVEVLDVRGDYVNVDKLISRLFYYPVEYNGEIVEPFIRQAPIDSLEFPEGKTVVLKDLSTYVDTEVRLIEQDEQSYTFEMTVTVGGTRLEPSRFQWFPDRGLAVITSQSSGYYQSREVILNIKRCFALDIVVQDPSQPSAAQGYGGQY